MICQRIGFSPISIIGFGFRWLSSLIRVPKPPAKITTFIFILQSISFYLFSCMIILFSILIQSLKKRKCLSLIKECARICPAKCFGINMESTSSHPRSKRMQRGALYIVTVHSFRSNLVKMHSKSPLVIILLLQLSLLLLLLCLLPTVYLPPEPILLHNVRTCCRDVLVSPRTEDL